MTYSYSSPVMYDDPYKHSSISATAVGTLAGIAGGTAIGIAKNPWVNRDGQARDCFVKNVEKNYYKKFASENEKKIYEQTKNVLKKIDSVKSSDELKQLFADNSELKNAQNIERLLDSIDDNKLSKSIKALKNTLKASQETTSVSIRNTIDKCWDKEAKKFISLDGDEFSKNVSKAVEKSKGWFKARFIGKCVGITAIAGGLIGFIVDKLINNNNVQ